MPRANRYFLPGYVWHITHRCHGQQFLLRFARDRHAWCRWLFEARRRYGLCVLNYTVTSNHIHLLVRDRGLGEIPLSMQLIAGRVGQAYNRRKGRKGAFWEDRYHATAVDTGAYLARCLVYVDLNMVRAGVVAHPAQWPAGGYHEIQTPRQRYRIVDTDALREALACSNTEQLREVHRAWLEATLERDAKVRDPVWTENLAVGSEAFCEAVHSELGARGHHRSTHEQSNATVVREPATIYYSDYSTPENDPLSS